MARGTAFTKVAIPKPRRSTFDLTHSNLFDADMGQLIPVCNTLMIPGDYFKVNTEVVIRLQTMIRPMLQDLNAYVHYFFVPLRLIWDGWEDFITGGPDGTNDDSLPSYTPDLLDTGPYTLWDYFGFPQGVRRKVNAFPWLAYDFIFDEYYRDQNLQEKRAPDPGYPVYPYLRNWEKDYFTSSLPFQQRGTAPAFPITGNAFTEFTFQEPYDGFPRDMQYSTNLIGSSDARFNPNNESEFGAVRALNNSNFVNLDSVSSFDVTDVRFAFALQRQMEHLARGGARYTEYLTNIFGVSNGDRTLSRPVYTGGMKFPVPVSQIPQTEATNSTSPQGNLAGIGLGLNSSNTGSYKATEHGVFMGILSVMPKATYSQGINRQWLNETRWDFPTPALAHLSEQPIYNDEIWADPARGITPDTRIFGYQGWKDEYRTMQDRVHGSLVNTNSFWNMQRLFFTQPTLSQEFIECDPGKRPFVTPSEPTMIIHINNQILARRPMPVVADPGKIDHN